VCKSWRVVVYGEQGGADDNGHNQRAAGPRHDSRSDVLFASPPGRWFHAIAVVVLAAILWSDSYPDLWVSGLLFVSLSLVMLCVAWFVRLAVHLWARLEGWGRGRSRMLAVLPALVAIVVVIHALDLPFALRWKLSEDAFNEAAATVWLTPAEGSVPEWSERRVGLYTVGKTYRVGDDVYFRLPGVGFLDQVGFACLPHGPGGASGRHYQQESYASPGFTPLGGCWYIWLVRDKPT
jgi:hypothetical protein